MALSRDLSKIVQAVEERAVVTCSTANQSFAATGNVVQSTTFASGVSGRIIDRFGVELQRLYRVAEPVGYIWTTRGSTEADARLTLFVKLQHGASSCGGDMADYSTGSQADDRSFFTTVMATAMGSFSTGQLYGQTNPAYYDLSAAKQFIRAVVGATKNKVTTESSGFESARVGAFIRFGGADELPDRANTTGAGSTSTSTST